MKLSQISPLWKFFAGLVVYALVVWGITLFDDYRVSVFGFFILCFLTFALALWGIVRNKKALVVLLVVALSLQPTRAGEDKDAIVPIIVGCGILIVGGVIIYGIYKICKKLPPPKKKNNPPATNEPPELMLMSGSSTNGPVLIMPEADITEWNDWDIAVMQFESSTNAQDWQAQYVCTNWFNNSQFVSILYSNGLALKTNFGSAYWTNDAMISDFSAVMPPHEEAPLRLWRGLQLQ